MTNSPVLPHEAAAELLRRRQGRTNLEAFTTYTKPGYEVNWHHRVFFHYLDRFVAGDIRRLMVFAPPRHGKSEVVSRRLPAYILGRNPEAQLIACSYAADLSSRMNRDVQRIIDDPSYKALFPETRLFSKSIRTAHGSYLRNSDMFEVVNYSGAYRSSGVGGGIMGMGFDYGIIDDPIKNAEEAASETLREKIWEWYTSTFYTRQAQAARILVTVTRWHVDDLAGRLLAQGEDGDQWTVLRFPALAEDPTADDPRQPGEALWPSRFNVDFLAKVRTTLGTYQWSALYQQQPVPRSGGLFKQEWFRHVVDAVPMQARRVRYWDKAGTAGGGKRTSGVLIARTPEGIYFVEDVVLGQWSAREREVILLQTAQRDAAQHGGAVQIWVEQEPGSGGKESAEYTVQNLAGYAIHAETVGKAKEARAEPFAVQCEAGNVRLLRAPWNFGYIEELCLFPQGKYADQVDASSGAFNKLALAPAPGRPAAGTQRSPVYGYQPR